VGPLFGSFAAGLKPQIVHAGPEHAAFWSHKRRFCPNSAQNPTRAPSFEAPLAGVSGPPQAPGVRKVVNQQPEREYLHYLSPLSHSPTIVCVVVG
jgi:hypothetical protein